MCSMMGVKGKDFLDAVWDMAVTRGCKCQETTEDNFDQDVLGAISCRVCYQNIFTQDEVDSLERSGQLPEPNISCDWRKQND